MALPRLHTPFYPPAAIRESAFPRRMAHATAAHSGSQTAMASQSSASFGLRPGTTGPRTTEASPSTGWAWPNQPVILGILATLVFQVGCTSAITSATVREALRQTAARVSTSDHAATSQPDEPMGEPAEAIATGDPLGRVADDAESAAPVPSLEEAIARAEVRLADDGGLDATTRGVLVQTLQSTRPRDWPAIVDEFVAALQDGRAARGAETAVATAPSPAVNATKASPSADPAPLRFPESAATMAAPEPPPAAPALLPTMIRAARPIIRPAGAMVAAAHIELVDDDPPADHGGSGDPALPAAAASTARGDGPIVQNACFATRVRAWGVVDRFPQAAFRAGQEVIVYFELEGLVARPSAAGHTTGVDTVFRLVGADGTVVEEWTFAPLVETCHAPRRDYFVRYFLTMPEGVPAGQYRLEFLVSDTLGGASTDDALDLEIVPR